MLIMSGVCILICQFSFCVFIECGDSFDFINVIVLVMVKYVSQCVGLGVNVGCICGLGSFICGGEVFYIGCIFFYKYFEMVMKSCFQGGVWGGVVILFYFLWYIEVELLLVFKNNCGVEENCVCKFDYGVQFNCYMYQCL